MTDLIRYNKIFTIQRGILTYSAFPIQENSKFYGYSKTEFNLLCLSTFGSFFISPIIYNLVENESINDDNLRILGKIIDSKFSPNWVRYYENLSLEYDILNNTYNSEIEIIQGTSTSNDETNTQENRDIYAFNSIESVNDSKNDSTMTGTKNFQNNNRREKTTKGNNGVITPQQSISAELAFRRKSIIDYILSDLKQFATLAVVF